LLNPKLDNNKNNILIYGCLWVSYSHKNNIENRNAEIEYIKEICDPILVDQILDKTSKIANKDKIKIYTKNFTDLLAHDNEMSMAAKSSILEKISALASVDENLDKTEYKVLKEISALLKLPDSFLEALLKKLF
jgi:putative cell wall-binding protein